MGVGANGDDDSEGEVDACATAGAELDGAEGVGDPELGMSIVCSQRSKSELTNLSHCTEETRRERGGELQKRL